MLVDNCAGTRLIRRDEGFVPFKGTRKERPHGRELPEAPTTTAPI